MPDTEMTASECAILVVLMAEDREVLNTDLREWYGLDVRKEQRDKLADKLHYIASRRVKRTYGLQLAEEGWARVQQDFDFTLRGAGALSAGLAALQRNLRDRVLARADCATFTELFARNDIRPGSRPAGTTDAALRQRIVAAGTVLAEKPKAFVSLSRVRPFFPDVTRDELDEALRRLYQDGEVNLVPESNQRSLTDADADAALRVGGQENHLLAIGV